MVREEKQLNGDEKEPVENTGEIKEKEGMEKMEENAQQPSGTAELEQKLQEKEEELKKCQDKVLRLAAELENFKKRVEREKLEHMKYALEEFAKELLPFLDNLERAIEAAQDNSADSALLEGINLTLSGVRKILERFKVQPVTALGEPFDPNYHQAMMQEESDDHPPNTVIRELQKGYLIHDRLLRPALVVVSKAGSQQGASAEGKDSNDIN